jgi:NAD(P)-dependent dehydrogenase (short-subunit alcohol dehydrogenase family)
MSDRIAGTTALVTGASRGFGRGIAIALSRADAQVVGVARDRAALDELRAELGGSFTAVSADAADPTVAYAAEESARAGLGIRFVSVLPQLTAATALGSVYVAAYAARQGGGAGASVGDQGPALTPELVGQAITGLVAGSGLDQDAYVLSAAGLRPLA